MVRGRRNTKIPWEKKEAEALEKTEASVAGIGGVRWETLKFREEIKLVV